MDFVQQFDRLIRMVQETGERIVVAVDREKDPVVILPLAAYEQLTKRTVPLAAPSSDVADVWDGEYDADRIFAQVNMQRHTAKIPNPSERVHASASRASSVFGSMNPSHSPTFSEAPLSGEERFSLGVG